MATLWLIHGGNRGRMVPTFLRDCVVGAEFPDLADGRSLDRSATVKALGGGLEPSKAVLAEAAEFLSFVRRIEVGDVVLLPDPAAKGLVCGVVSGDYHYEPDLDVSRFRHRRPVEWRRRLPYTDLPERLSQLPRQRGTVTDVPDGRLRTMALECCALERGADPMDRPRGAATASAGRRSRSSGSPRRAATPPPRTVAERRCMACLMKKPEDHFDGAAEFCIDCSA